MSGALWAAASGVGFGLFQSFNRRAGRGIEDPYVSTFLQLAIAAVVLLGAMLATEDLDRLGAATAWSIVAFALAGIVHFLLGWTFLNISQQRVGAARTAPLLTLTPLFGIPVALVALGELPRTAALIAIAPIVAGAYVLSRPGDRAELRPLDASFGLGTSLMWAISGVLTVEGLQGLHSPLIGVTIGLVAAAGAYGAALVLRGAEPGLRIATVAREALTAKLVAALLVALATWWRWLALDGAAVGVVLALNLLAVPTVLFVAPIVVGRDLERVDLNLWAGSALVVGGSFLLIAVA